MNKSQVHNKAAVQTKFRLAEFRLSKSYNKKNNNKRNNIIIRRRRINITFQVRVDTMGDKKTQIVDYYEILQTNRDASVEELKRNYQRLALTLHPDKRKQEESESFLLLQKAWSVLRDPIMRKQYDAELICQEHTELLIFETISLKDMKFLLDEGIYTYNCRCGGTYILEVMDSRLPTVIIGCDECSFSIKINL